MPWNEPGENGNKNDNKNQDPWGGKNNQSPPDLDKILADFVKKLRGVLTLKKGGFNTNWKFSSGNKDHHYGFAITMAVIAVVWMLSGFFIVNPAEEAVILRFGKYSDVLQPGLHWMARFIDTKYLVDVQKIYSFSLQGDFLTKSSEQNELNSQYVQLNSATQVASENDQSKNLVNVELNVQYRISDPRAYLFNVVNTDDTIHQVAAGVLSDVIGKMKLDDVLTTGREQLSFQVLELTRQVMKTYNAGLEVVAVTLRKAQAPDQVQVAFNDVNRADQDRSTTIQQAQAYASKVVPLAQGAAARIMADANGYQQQIVLTAQANVAKYQALLNVYSIAPDITRERMYLETMQNVFTHTTKILVDFNSSSNMLYLPLDKLMKQAEQSASTNPNSDNSNVVTPQVMQGASSTVNDNSQTTNVGVKNDTN